MNRLGARKLASSAFQSGSRWLPSASNTSRSAMPALGEGEYYHADLIGLAAVSPEGKPLGTIVAIDNYGAGDVLEIEQPDGRRAMVPMTRDAVPEWDQARAVIDPAFLV